MDKTIVCIIALCFFSLCLLINLLRAIFAHSAADKLISINMSGTVVICSTAILTVLLDEPWLADICILYALLSFIAVIVITKIYIGASIDKEQKEKEEKTDGDR